MRKRWTLSSLRLCSFKYCSTSSFNDLEGGSGCTLSKFADDTELGGVADRPKGCADVQSDLKHSILHLGSTPRHQYMLEANWLGDGCTEKDLGVLVGNWLAMSQQHACVGKEASSVMGCIRKSASRMLRETSFRSTRHW